MKYQAKMNSFKAVLLASAFGMVLPTAAVAQDVTIDTETTDQVDLVAGQTLTITNTGSVVTPADRAIYLTPGGTGTTTIINYGRIEAAENPNSYSTIGAEQPDIKLNLTNEAGAFIEGARGVYYTSGELINRGTITARQSNGSAIRAGHDSIVRLDAGSVTSVAAGSTGYAVSFTAGGNSIYIDTDATVNGAIRAVAGSEGPNLVYLVGSGVQTLGAISGFNGYHVQSGDWTVAASLGGTGGNSHFAGRNAALGQWRLQRQHQRGPGQ